MAEGFKIEQKHGKSKVRVARVWRRIPGSGDVIVEWNVTISLFSDCLPAYTSGDNSAIVATDSMKNTVYVKAKQCTEVISAEGFALLLGKHFTSYYPQVTAAVVSISEKPWDRVTVDGRPHSHGFKLGSEKHLTEVRVEKYGTFSITSGFKGLSLLKTTQSGFEGFVRDQFTLLPETRERMVASEISASWSYQYSHSSDIPGKPFCFTKRFLDVKKVLADTFFGPPVEGVYSPSVQNTLYFMAKAVLNRFPDVASVKLVMPNLHFLPVNLSSKNNPNMVKMSRKPVLFADDVYMPTDEPHGTIEATVKRTMSRM